MYIKAQLKTGVDCMKVYADLSKFNRVNIGKDGGKDYVYYFGNKEDGDTIYDYLHPLAEEMAVRIGY